jgi:hypothetical protein
VLTASANSEDTHLHFRIRRESVLAMPSRVEKNETFLSRTGLSRRAVEQSKRDIYVATHTVCSILQSQSVIHLSIGTVWYENMKLVETGHV